MCLQGGSTFIVVINYILQLTLNYGVILRKQSIANRIPANVLFTIVCFFYWKLSINLCKHRRWYFFKFRQISYVTVSPREFRLQRFKRESEINTVLQNVCFKTFIQ